MADGMMTTLEKPAPNGASPATLGIPVEGTSLARQDRLSLPQLFNISLGFLGIQFAWAVQQGQVGPLLQSLGATPTIISLANMAGPATGVLVQPIVGILSDRCGLAMGRRRPFLLLGTLLTAASLLLMPYSPHFLVVALLLWILDASINVSQGPYRALVPDIVPRAQQATAFSLMGLIIGLGSVLMFLIGFYVSDMVTLFNLGAIAMLVAMGWTILTSRETPRPASEPAARKSLWASVSSLFGSMFGAIAEMPAEAKKLCLTHSFTWFGLMCLFGFFSVYVPQHVYHALPGTADYDAGRSWMSLCYAVMNGVCFLISPCIAYFSNATSKKFVHTLGLLCLAVGMGLLFVINTPQAVMGAMALVGVGWATTLSLPFALLSDHLPSGREGVLMGTFNIFIAAPGVLANALMGPVIEAGGGNFALAMAAGSIAVLCSAVLLQFVHESKTVRTGSAAPDVTPVSTH